MLLEHINWNFALGKTLTYNCHLLCEYLSMNLIVCVISLWGDFVFFFLRFNHCRRNKSSPKCSLGDKWKVEGRVLLPPNPLLFLIWKRRNYPKSRLTYLRNIEAQPFPGQSANVQLLFSRHWANISTAQLSYLELDRVVFTQAQN